MTKFLGSDSSDDRKKKEAADVKALLKLLGEDESKFDVLYDVALELIEESKQSSSDTDYCQDKSIHSELSIEDDLIDTFEVAGDHVHSPFGSPFGSPFDSPFDSHHDSHDMDHYD